MCEYGDCVFVPSSVCDIGIDAQVIMLVPIHSNGSSSRLVLLQLTSPHAHLPTDFTEATVRNTLLEGN